MKNKVLVFVVMIVVVLLAVPDEFILVGLAISLAASLAA